MTHIVGDLVVGEDGDLCIKMQISPQNSEVINVPIKELLEDYINKRVVLEINHSEPRWGKPAK